MPSIYQPRRFPLAYPLWQLVHHGWDEFLAHYESKYRKDLGPLHPAATATETLRDAFRTRLNLPAIELFRHHQDRHQPLQTPLQHQAELRVLKGPRLHRRRPHSPPAQGQQTVRYFGLYSNKTRGQISPIPDRIIRLPKPEP